MAKRTVTAPTVVTTAAVPFWDPNPAAYEQFEPVTNWSPWDTAVLAGLRVPGLVRTGTRKRRRFVQQAAVGSQQVEMVDVGVEPVMVEFQCTMWTPEHLQQYAALAATIEIKPNTTPAAYAVTHPGLAMLNIMALYITSISSPTPTSPGGPFTATIEAQNFVRKKKDVTTGGGVFAIDKSKVVAPKNAQDATKPAASPAAAPKGSPLYVLDP